MVAPAVAADAAPVVLGMSPDRNLKRYTLPREAASWGAVKGKHLSPHSSAPGPQKVSEPQLQPYHQAQLICQTIRSWKMLSTFAAERQLTAIYKLICCDCRLEGHCVPT